MPQGSLESGRALTSPLAKPSVSPRGLSGGQQGITCATASLEKDLGNSVARQGCLCHPIKPLGHSWGHRAPFQQGSLKASGQSGWQQSTVEAMAKPGESPRALCTSSGGQPGPSKAWRKPQDTLKRSRALPRPWQSPLEAPGLSVGHQGSAWAPAKPSCGALT